MKKIFLILTVCVGFAVTSCKKDHVCSCTNTSTQPGSTATTIEITIVEARKSDAKKMCVKTTQDNVVGGVTYTDTNDCKLK